MSGYGFSWASRQLNWMSISHGARNMEHGITVPEGVGPHEGRECAMMLAGTKPLAMFCEVATHADYFPESDFAPHVASGRILRREELYWGAKARIMTRCVFYALPGHEWRMEAAHAIQKAIFTGDQIGRASGRERV